MHQPPIPHIDAEDPEIAGLIHDEARRQAEKFRLIPSENYVSLAVLEACGTVLTNKYSEGYPGRRYYEGQQLIDPLESIAIERAQALFGADHANVQPYSGSPANLAVYLAFAKPGDTIMGMSLSAGGHLTHGSPASVTGKWFRAGALRRAQGDRPGRHGRRPRARARRSGRRSSSAAAPRSRARSTSRPSPRSPPRSARCSSRTSRTSPA